MKRLWYGLLALVLVLGLAGCGAKSAGSYYANSGSPSYDMAVEMPAEAEMAPTPAADPGYWKGETSGNSSSPNALPAGVKMIYTANLEMQSLEFDQTASDLAALVEQMGGYFESRSMNNYSSGYRRASYTVRVPTERFESFLHQAGEICHVTYSSQSAQDITEQYFDTDSRLKTAQTKLERLQELLARAESMEDIITIESAISDTEYEIESLSGTLRHYDALVGYSTIYVELSEVYKLTETEEAPLSFGARLARSFKEGLASFGEFLEDAAVWLAYHWLGLLVFIAVIVLIVRLIRRLAHRAPRIRKSKKNAVQNNDPAQPQEPENKE